MGSGYYSGPLRLTRCSVLRELLKSTEVRFACQLFSFRLCSSLAPSSKSQELDSATAQNIKTSSDSILSREALSFIKQMRRYSYLTCDLQWLGFVADGLGLQHLKALTTAVKRLDCAPTCCQHVVPTTRARSFSTFAAYIRLLRLANDCRAELHYFFSVTQEAIFGKSLRFRTFTTRPSYIRFLHLANRFHWACYFLFRVH